jgi:4-diphosphocytidyl-2-C-methyl-D-erythritol kinase
MLVYPNAKINLGLTIIERRTDGYHNLETIFYPINWCDSLEFIEAIDGKTEFFIEGIQIEGNWQNNLVYRAYQLLKNIKPLPELKIFLYKNIPTGAGLGGGSANAAFMLRALNDFFELNFSDDFLLEQASKLGADCPFFIYNQPCFATEIGNKLTLINEKLKGFYILVIKPSVSVNTAKAYSKIKPQKPQYNLKEIYLTEPIENWKNFLFNDFEPVVFNDYPIIKSIKDLLYNQGALYAAMSGSGSAVFGIFNKEIFINDALLKECIVWKGKL